MKLRCSMLLLRAVQNKQTSTSPSGAAGSTSCMSTLNTTGDSDTDLFSDLNGGQSDHDQPHLQYLQDSRRDLYMLSKHPAVKSV